MASDTYGVGYNSKTIEGRYNQYARDRELFLERGRDCAQFTIPTLIPDEGSTSTARFNTPYQGIGARGVNNLASKLLLTLLPPNAPFFRFSIDNFALKEIEEDENLKTEIDKGLVEVEKAVMEDIEIRMSENFFVNDNKVICTVQSRLNKKVDVLKILTSLEKQYLNRGINLICIANNLG